MLLGTLEKQPNERRLRVFNYADALVSEDTIISAVLTSVSPTGLTVDTVTAVSPLVSFFVAGGTDGVKYTVTITSTSASGEIFEDELSVRVKEVS